MRFFLPLLLLANLVIGETETPEIVKGTPAKASEFRYFAGIYRSRDVNDYWCSGFWVDDYTVLTAAHCVYGMTDFLFVRHAPSSGNSQQLDSDPIPVKSVKTHPDYNPDRVDFGADLALLYVYPLPKQWETIKLPMNEHLPDTR